MTYELREGRIHQISSPAKQTTDGTMLRCPGCGGVDLKLIDGLVGDPQCVETCTTALQCCYHRCGTIYQIVTKLAWPFVQIAKGGT